MKFDIILQCRSNSKRLPNKIFYKINDLTILEILILNLKKIKLLNKIVLAISYNEDVKKFRKITKKYNIDLFVNHKGISENNVLSRFFNCSKKYKFKNIIRITPDCPFINIHIVKKMMMYYKTKKLKFLTNNKPRKVPHGFDCEIFSFEILKHVYNNAKNPKYLEHVTMWIYKNKPDIVKNYSVYHNDYSNVRITLDYQRDYNFFVKNYSLLKKISILKNPRDLLKTLL